MATAIQTIEASRPGPASRSTASNSTRARIISAAAGVLQAEPDNFSVLRVARQAGISARAVYGHFESGAQLARAARLSTLQTIIARLPAGISNRVPPEVALRQFASEIADAIRPCGSAWLLASRQDDVFRSQYRQALRRPLIRQAETYIAGHLHDGQIAGRAHSRLAELLVTTIEAIVVNYDGDLALEIDCTESLDEIVQAICHAHSI